MKKLFFLSISILLISCSEKGEEIDVQAYCETKAECDPDNTTVESCTEEIGGEFLACAAEAEAEYACAAELSCEDLDVYLATPEESSCAEAYTAYLTCLDI